VNVGRQGTIADAAALARRRSVLALAVRRRRRGSGQAGGRLGRLVRKEVDDVIRGARCGCITSARDRPAAVIRPHRQIRLTQICLLVAPRGQACAVLVSSAVSSLSSMAISIWHPSPHGAQYCSSLRFPCQSMLCWASVKSSMAEGRDIERQRSPGSLGEAIALRRETGLRSALA
jgi:hypothetical protein